jgi:2,5-diketo-D-gluconate reductase A
MWSRTRLRSTTLRDEDHTLRNTLVRKVSPDVIAASRTVAGRQRPDAVSPTGRMTSPNVVADEVASATNTPLGRPRYIGAMTSPERVPLVTLPVGRMPQLGFGTWRLRGDQARAAVSKALAVGYRHIDTATMYDNEGEIGQALADSDVDRADLFLTTKIRPSDIGKERAVLHRSLRALGTDYLDLWLVHWPPSSRAGRREMWNELLAAKAEGYVRDVGVSNYNLAEIDELTTSAGQAPAVNQIDWGPRRYDASLLTGHAERGIAVEGYSGLKNTQLDNPVLAKVAAAHSVTTAQVVLRWHLEHDITVIPKSARPDRIAANFDVFGFQLTAAEVASIDSLAGGRRRS